MSFVLLLIVVDGWIDVCKGINFAMVEVTAQGFLTPLVPIHEFLKALLGLLQFFPGLSLVHALVKVFFLEVSDEFLETPRVMEVHVSLELDGSIFLRCPGFVVMI